MITDHELFTKAQSDFADLEKRILETFKQMGIIPKSRIHDTIFCKYKNLHFEVRMPTKGRQG